MTMMRAGRATVYAGPPPWDPVEWLEAYRVDHPRVFLVGRCLPSENLMAIAWLQPSRTWTLDEAGSQPLGWLPIYIAEAPAFPPWPPSEHPSMAPFVDHEGRLKSWGDHGLR